MSNGIIPPCDEIYLRSLSTIDHIRFSRREIDVMSCLLKGKAAKKVASTLSVAPKTVATHLRNIMLKLNVNSKEGIFEFMERTSTTPIFLAYYQALLLSFHFEHVLEKLALRIAEKPRCTLIFWKSPHSEKNTAIQLLKNYLEVLGVPVSLDEKSDSEPFLNPYKKGPSHYQLYVVFPDDTQFERLISQLPPTDSSQLFLFLGAVPPCDGKKEYIGLDEYGTFYLFFLAVVQKLFPKCDVGDLIANFKDLYDKGQYRVDSDKAPISLRLLPSSIRWNRKNIISCLWIVAGICLCGGFYMLKTRGFQSFTPQSKYQKASSLKEETEAFSQLKKECKELEDYEKRVSAVIWLAAESYQTRGAMLSLRYKSSPQEILPDKKELLSFQEKLVLFIEIRNFTSQKIK